MLNNFNELSTWVSECARKLKLDDNNDFDTDNDYNDCYCEIEEKTRLSDDKSTFKQSNQQDQKHTKEKFVHRKEKKRRDRKKLYDNERNQRVSEYIWIQC